MSLTPIAVLYTYLGASTPVVIDYAQPDIRLDRTLAHNGASAAGAYPGFDRFGRVIRHMWVDNEYYEEHDTDPTVPAVPPIVEIAYGYDKASNRTKAIDARPGAGQPLSHGYTYDGLHRLAEAKRNVSSNGDVTSVAAGSQQWELDTLGNWKSINTATSGSYGTAETRVHNTANELTEITLPSSATLDLLYDKSGNLRKQEIKANTHRIYVYDAWNRLRRVHHVSGTTATLFAEYQYNGLNWRTTRWADLRSGAQTRRMYYSANWQLLQEDIDDNATSSFQVDRRMQYLWGPPTTRYIDDIILHREDSNINGTYDKTWYHLTDAQFSTVAIVDENANLAERVTYSAYGEARHHWAADVNGDGAVTSEDRDIIDDLWQRNSGDGTTIDESEYRAEADLNRDGVIDEEDYDLSVTLKAALGAGQLSSGDVGNVVGYAGYLFNGDIRGVDQYHVRHRVYDVGLGRWLTRDPAGFVDGMNLYEYGRSQPTNLLDPTGTVVVAFTGALDYNPPTTDDGRKLTQLPAIIALAGGGKEASNAYKHTEVPAAETFVRDELKKECNQAVIVFGHSWGANAGRRLAQALRRTLPVVQVDLLVYLDPVWPPFTMSTAVPPNVKLARNFYQRDTNVFLFKGGFGFGAKDVDAGKWAFDNGHWDKDTRLILKGPNKNIRDNLYPAFHNDVPYLSTQIKINGKTWVDEAQEIVRKAREKE